ncbi:hypothetical protein [Peribacillus sp. SCS-155]|uniref:hypothetical protein n=1 Tax=Peribacillus sedimenti TaxID=3115297 RepID=UPI003905DD35
MQIYATFEHSRKLELGIAKLQSNGISDIFAVPLKRIKDGPKIIDSIDHSDGRSLLDKGFVLATVFSTILASKGFEWDLGPIYWGLIGGASGIILGLLIELVEYRWQNKDKLVNVLKNNKYSEVILIVTCEKNQAETVSNILKEHLALSLAKVECNP